jgi:hypothetical protein
MTRLKDRTLKKAYEQKTVRESSSVLTETMDPKEIEKITNGLKALQGLVPTEAVVFSTAIQSAVADIQKYMAGGVGQAIKNVLSDPVAKATVLANAIKNGLAQGGAVLQAFIPQDKKQDPGMVWDIVPEENRQNMIKAMVRVFKVNTTNRSLSSLLKGEQIPYVKNLDIAVTELLQHTNSKGMFDFSAKAKSIQEPQPESSVTAAPGPGNQPATAGGQAVKTPDGSVAPTAGATPTKAANGTEPTKQASADTGTTATKQAAAAPTNKRLDDPGKLPVMAKSVSSFTGVDEATAQKVLQFLMQKKGLLDVELGTKSKEIPKQGTGQRGKITAGESLNRVPR